MSIDTTLTQELWEVTGAISASDFTSGPTHALGTIKRMPAVRSNSVLYYVDAGDAAATDGAPVGTGVDNYSPGTDEEAVTHFADTGDMEWIYVETGATAVRRGEPLVKAAADASYANLVACAATDNASEVVGVAQHNIAANSYGWILRKGVGVVAGDGSVVAGEGLICAAGAADSEAADTNSIFGRAAEADGTTYAAVNSKVLAKASLNCQG